MTVSDETTNPTAPIIDDGTIYVVAGTPNLTGYDWNGSIDTGNDMQRQGNVFVHTFPNVDIIDEEFQIKVVANKDGEQTWIGDENGFNIPFKVTKVTDVTVTFDPATNAITVSGDGVVMITELEIDSMRIAGAADEAKGEWLHGISWQPGADENLMEEITDKVYQIRFTTSPKKWVTSSR